MVNSKRCCIQSEPDTETVSAAVGLNVNVVLSHFFNFQDGLTNLSAGVPFRVDLLTGRWIQSKTIIRAYGHVVRQFALHYSFSDIYCV